MSINKLNRAIYENATQMYVLLEELARTRGLKREYRDRIIMMINMIRREAGESEYHDR